MKWFQTEIGDLQSSRWGPLEDCSDSVSGVEWVVSKGAFHEETHI